MPLLICDICGEEYLPYEFAEAKILVKRKVKIIEGHLECVYEKWRRSRKPNEEALHDVGDDP